MAQQAVKDREKKELQEYTHTLFDGGYLTVSVDGQRVARINEDCSPNCPHCGKPMDGGLVQTVAALWKGVSDRTALIEPSKNHNRWIQTYPLLHENVACPCGNTVNLTVQLVL